MQQKQHDETNVPSEAFQRIMARRRRREIRKRIILAAIAAGAAITLTVFGGGKKDAVSADQATEAPTQAQSRVEPMETDLTTKVITILIEVPPEENSTETEETQPQDEPETETETEAPATEAPREKRWNDKEAYLLAKIAMAEAEGEDTVGKALVILTVLNRVQDDRFPDTIEEVIYQAGQFAPIWNGRFDRVEPSEDCWAALAMVESGWDESQGALYFRTTTAEETWHSRNLKELFPHGNHTFYTEVNEK